MARSASGSESRALTTGPRVTCRDNSASTARGTDLRKLMQHPELRQLLLATMSQRLARTQISELPRFGGVDQDTLRDLRTAQPAAQPANPPRADAAAAV